MTRLQQQNGFTLVEVIMASVVLTVGILGLIATFDGARKLTLVAERRSAAAHRAQWEMEKLQAESYAQMAMISAPAHSSETLNPDYYVNYNSPVKCTSEGGGCYAANTEKLTEEEAIVYAAKECKTSSEENCGLVSGSASGKSCLTNAIGSCEWKDGNTSGYVYDFVTWHSDTVCSKEEKGKKICSTKSDKRLTVVSTVIMPSGSHYHPTIRISSIVSNPSATPEGSVINGKENPLESPETKCGSESCITGIQRGNADSWYFQDSAASSETATAPTVSHTLHNTISGSGSVPDLMTEGRPTATKLYDYSTNLDSEGSTFGSSEYGGRVLHKEAECSGTPGNSGGETWATPKLAAATKLTGYGGLTIYTQTLGDVTGATVELCIGVYDYPETITGTPTPIGVVGEYKPTAEWPTTATGDSLTGLSFVFTFLSESKLQKLETVTVEAKHHIGVRIWPASSSTASIAVAYATTGSSVEEGGKLIEAPGYPSHVQLNTE